MILNIPSLEKIANGSLSL